MRLGLIGGTGKEGSGLGMRWARAGHRVAIGSRDAERARKRAAELSKRAGVAIEGGDNAWAAGDADIVVLCVPYAAHAATLQGLRSALSGKLVVDITVPLRPPRVREVHLPEGHSAALEARAILGDDVTIVAALHHVSSVHLADVDHQIACDVLVCSDDAGARARVIELIGDLGLRGLDAGKLQNAVALESLTPVLLHMNKHYKSAGTGIVITGIPQASDES